MMNAFPQRGIIMGVSGNTAQVLLPLTKFETGYIDSTVAFDDSMVGKQVVVTFINGDINQGVITGVIQ